MKFKDPHNVTCPRCSTSSAQSVAKLLALEAACPECFADLAETGLRMRRKLDEASTYFIAIELMLVLEKTLNCKFGSEGLEQVKTLGDLLSFVGPARKAAATRAMAEAVQQVRRNGIFSSAYTGPDPNAALNFDDPLIQVFSP